MGNQVFYLKFETDKTFMGAFKIFIVEDRMNSKKGYYHVDVWFEDYHQAKDFGVKTTYIEVLEG